MSDAERYMHDLHEVFTHTRRQGPGSEAATLRAYRALPRGFAPRRILEMGCGAVPTSLLLARESGALVVTLDKHLPFLNRLVDLADGQGFGHKVAFLCASMLEPPFAARSFDLVWSEGSAYVMGFQNVLRAWRQLLSAGGCLVLSEAVWLAKNPDPELREFWQREYPDMRGLAARLAQAWEEGYVVLDSFVIPLEDWDAFYADVARSLAAALNRYGPSPAFDDLKREIAIYKRFRGEYGYAFLVLQSDR